MLYLTADLHFGHKRISELAGRPYSSVEEMDRCLVENWNETVSPGDDVWVLGDLCMGNIKDTLTIIPMLNGHISLLPGNHDRCWEGHSDGFGWRQRYLDAGIEDLLRPWTAEFDGTKIGVDHFPFRTDTADKHREYMPVDVGQWLFHGHVHDAWRANGRQINVGVEAWNYTPVSIDHLMALIEILEDSHERTYGT